MFYFIVIKKYHLYTANRLQKYRPTTFNDIVGNEPSVNILKSVAKKGNIPNFLLSGPPGVGKTSSIICLANELYGKELAKKAILELNASDERYNVIIIIWRLFLFI